jgi:hypothetical protein
MKLLLLSAACSVTLPIHAQIWQFDLGGLAGSGLRGGNEPSVAIASPASGDELNKNFPSDFPSISYNTTTHELRLPIGWGSANSGPNAAYTDLTAPETVWHIHGPVASNPGDDVNDYFTRSTSPLPTYTYVTPNDQTGDGSRRSGSFDTTITLQDLTLNGSPYTVAQQEQDLRDGRWYVNVHSQGTYAGGEIRGQLLYVVPEPEQYAALAGLALVGFAGYRKLKKRCAQPA